MFDFVTQALKKIYTQVALKMQELFSGSPVDEAMIKELERLLIQADTGVKTARAIRAHLEEQLRMGILKNGDDVRRGLGNYLVQIASAPTGKDFSSETIYLLVGINGSGKTTFAGKLTHYLKNRQKRPLLVAADTFRAAAREQLSVWADRTSTPIVTGTADQEPASVVFAGCQSFKQGGYDALVIDTAGRLQTKSHLMRELEKIKKIIRRELPEATICTLLTIDAMLGQNSLEQAQLFHESAALDGVVLTKMDGTGKGGIIFSIIHELAVPIAYLSFGEYIDQLKPFDAQDYVHGLLGPGSVDK